MRTVRITSLKLRLLRSLLPCYRPQRKASGLEKSNKAKLETLMVNQRKKIKNLRLGNETVASYYKNMSNQSEGRSYFYDKKK